MAGRKKKISSEELQIIIDKYTHEQPSSLLVPSKLARFAQAIGYYNIIYKDFTNNHEVMEYISSYNSELKKALDNHTYAKSIYCTKDAHDFFRKNNTEEKRIRAIQWIDSVLLRNAETINQLQAENALLKKELTELRENMEVLTTNATATTSNSAILEKQIKILSQWIDINMNHTMATHILARRQDPIQINTEEIVEPLCALQTDHLMHGQKNTHKKVPFSFKELDKPVSDLPNETNTINQILKALEDIKNE